MKLALFYHVWCTNHWKEIVQEQIALIVESGLAQNAKIFIGVIGTWHNIVEIADIIDGLDAHVIGHGEDPEQFEFPTLEVLRLYAASHDGYVCYIHSKGVSHQKNELHDWWRATMNEGVLTGWSECVMALDAGYDVAGCRFKHTVHELNYFAGNFWWATCEHIRKLPDFTHSSRYEAEVWVVNGSPKEFHIPVDRLL